VRWFFLLLYMRFGGLVSVSGKTGLTYDLDDGAGENK
jgi:hypothetical protein